MSKFVLAREAKKGGIKSLPGTPVAIVRSKNPDHDNLFLCTVDDADVDEDEGPSARPHNPYKGGRMGVEDEDDGSRKRESSRSRSPPAGAGAGRGKRPPPKDLDSAVFGEPFAVKAAARYADQTDIPSAQGDPSAGPKRPRGGALAAARAAETAADEKARFTAKRDTVVLPAGSSFQQLVPVEADKRFVQFIGGRSGAGKSYASAGLIKVFQKLHPGSPVFGVCKTKLKDDAVYAPLGIKQLPVSVFYAATGKLDIKALFGDGGCLVLFDDWDSFEGEEMETVLAAIKDIVNLGRKMNISIICTSHMLSDYAKTRVILREAQYLTFFPEHEQAGAMEYTCRKTLGLKADVVEEMNHLGRWVTLHNTRPKFLLSKNKAFMI